MNQRSKGKGNMGGYVPLDFLGRAKAAAEAEGITITALMIEAIEGWMVDRTTRVLVERNARQTAAALRRGK